MSTNKVVILFGLSGSGKNFVGEIMAKYFDFYFWDADQALPQEMQQCIEAKQPFTQEMRDNFTQDIIKNITELQRTHSKLVISQALYKEKNRQELYSTFPQAHFIHVDATLQNILLRLNKRKNVVDAQYAEKIRLNFEKPSLSHSVISNNSDEFAVITQFKQMNL